MTAFDDEAGGIGEQAGPAIEYLQPGHRPRDQLVRVIAGARDPEQADEGRLAGLGVLALF